MILWSFMHFTFMPLEFVNCKFSSESLLMLSYSLLSTYFSISLKCLCVSPVWHTRTPVSPVKWEGFPTSQVENFGIKEVTHSFKLSIWNTTPKSYFQMSGISLFLFPAGHLSVMDQQKLCNTSSWSPDMRSVWLWQSPKYFILKINTLEYQGYIGYLEYQG